jgi:hypothetical protein
MSQSHELIVQRSQSSIPSPKLTPPTKLTGYHARHRNVCATWSFSAGLIMDLDIPKDFKEFLRLLRVHGVEYLLIGGWAVGYYGYPRATDDLDVWIAIATGNARQVVAALRDFGFDEPELGEALFLQDDQLIRMGIAPLRIEVLTSISGVEFDECYSERREVTLDDEPVSLISLRHLKLNKKASGRLKDLNDLEHLPENES